MYRRFYVGFMLLACGGVCLLAAMAGTTAGTIAAGCCGDEKEPKAKEAKKAKATDDKGDCDRQVCPLYLWGYFGTYYAYYAFVCPGPTPVNLNLQDLVTPGGCAAPCTGCTPQITFTGPEAKKLAAKSARKAHHHDPKLRDGIVRGAPKIKKADYIRNVQTLADCTELLAPALVRLRTKADNSYTAWVYLYLVRVDPKTAISGTGAPPPPQVLSTGIEVDPSLVTEDPVATIPHGDIQSADGQVCTVVYGTVLYEVVLDKNAKIDPK
jgi:hypothetical protein